MSLDLVTRDDIRNTLTATLATMHDLPCSDDYWRGALAMARALATAMGVTLDVPRERTRAVWHTGDGDE